MNRVYVEQRQLNDNSPLAWDIAQHLYTRQFEGKVLIIAEHPKVFLSTLKKQWNKLTERTRRERSSVLQEGRARELERQLHSMSTYIFTLRDPLDQPKANVYIVGPDDLRSTLPYCMTTYITCHTDKALLDLFIKTMPSHALVVFYADR